MKVSYKEENNIMQDTIDKIVCKVMKIRQDNLMIVVDKYMVGFGSKKQ